MLICESIRPIALFDKHTVSLFLLAIALHTRFRINSGIGQVSRLMKKLAYLCTYTLRTRIALARFNYGLLVPIPFLTSLIHSSTLSLSLSHTHTLFSHSAKILSLPPAPFSGRRSINWTVTTVLDPCRRSTKLFIDRCCIGCLSIETDFKRYSAAIFFLSLKNNLWELLFSLFQNVIVTARMGD